MYTTKRLLYIFSFSILVSCAKTPIPPNKMTIAEVGTLQKQGATTYQYGSHVLKVNTTTTYVLKSSLVDLDPFVGKRVKITAVNTHHQVEDGPELYDVVTIVSP